MRIVLPSSRTETVGDGAGPAVAVRLADQKALLQLLRDPDLAFGELFMDGRMQVLEGSIYDVLAIAAQSVRNGVPISDISRTCDASRTTPAFAMRFLQ